MIHDILHWTGIDTQQSVFYDFWSGIATQLSVFIGMMAILRHANCNVKGCRSLLSYPVPHTQYRACRKHHPDIDETKHITPEIIKKAHEEAKNE